ncbi:hypothetical protein BB559_003091 [Furculomyces boomerangus]|uniref:Uncharacterized protein n=1 Tax=Furculomyces boomerangus TaxID=61424 RepID=A0A2T9YP77_9FUNG|nr:hypothetical protein BB559_003091 [Furculomyces boomerangus]
MSKKIVDIIEEYLAVPHKDILDFNWKHVHNIEIQKVINCEEDWLEWPALRKVLKRSIINNIMRQCNFNRDDIQKVIEKHPKYSEYHTIKCVREIHKGVVYESYKAFIQKKLESENTSLESIRSSVEGFEAVENYISSYIEGYSENSNPKYDKKAVQDEVLEGGASGKPFEEHYNDFFNADLENIDELDFKKIMEKHVDDQDTDSEAFEGSRLRFMLRPSLKVEEVAKIVAESTDTLANVFMMLDMFDNYPFTIQRLCELAYDNNYYSSNDFPITTKPLSDTVEADKKKETVEKTQESLLDNSGPMIVVETTFNQNSNKETTTPAQTVQDVNLSTKRSTLANAFNQNTKKASGEHPFDASDTGIVHVDKSLLNPSESKESFVESHKLQNIPVKVDNTSPQPPNSDESLDSDEIESNDNNAEMKDTSAEENGDLDIDTESDSSMKSESPKEPSDNTPEISQALEDVDIS